MEILGQERLRVSLRCMDIMKPERQDLERAHVMWVGPSHDGEDAKQLKKVSGQHLAFSFSQCAHAWLSRIRE